jgi:hypothetical protein
MASFPLRMSAAESLHDNEINEQCGFFSAMALF